MREIKLEHVADIEGKGFTQSTARVYSSNGLAPTLTTMQGGHQEPKVKSDAIIRKLTPRECFRLMGFSDEDFDACKSAGISDSQLYKQAGNSIVVPVLEAIFKELL